MLALLLAAAAVCPPQKLEAARFTPGEILSYKLDAVGMDVGTFEVRVQAPPAGDKKVAIALTSRAKTTAFVSTNVGRYDAFATALMAADFSPVRYREDIDEGDTHKAIDVDFPPPADGVMPVRASTNGHAEAFSVTAGSDVRDIISTLYLLRAQPMKPGTPVCVEVFAGRKIWKVSGQLSARETIDTPLGKFATMRIDADAVRVDDPRVKRGAHVWVSDDDKRLPLVAIGEVRGKVIRAQLVAATGVRIAQRRK